MIFDITGYLPYRYTPFPQSPPEGQGASFPVIYKGKKGRKGKWWAQPTLIPIGRMTLFAPGITDRVLTSSNVGIQVRRVIAVATGG